MRETYNLLKNEGGIRQIFKGLHPALARGYVVNMVTLPMYDAVKDQLSGNQEWSNTTLIFDRYICNHINPNETP